MMGLGIEHGNASRETNDQTGMHHKKGQTEANEYLIRKYFLEDDPAKDTKQMRGARQERVHYAIRDEPDRTEGKIEEVIGILKKKKAVSDRTPNEAVTEIWKAIGHKVVEVFQECWVNGVFPMIWKRL